MFSKFSAAAFAIIAATVPLRAAPRVEITSARGVYSVTARFAVAAPPETVLGVLTDYGSIPDYSSAVIKSEIKSRAGSLVYVEQTGVRKILGFFGIRARLLLKIAEGDKVIDFEDVSGRDFRIYRGHWSVKSAAGGSEVEYSLTAEPAFYVPGFIGNMVFASSAREMCEELVSEIDRRYRPTVPR